MLIDLDSITTQYIVEQKLGESFREFRDDGARFTDDEAKKWFLGQKLGGTLVRKIIGNTTNLVIQVEGNLYKKILHKVLQAEILHSGKLMVFTEMSSDSQHVYYTYEDHGVEHFIELYFKQKL